MHPTADFVYRPATPEDAILLSVLATQIFLDTYATRGVNDDLAQEAITAYSPQAMAERLVKPLIKITLAERKSHLVGFLDLSFESQCPVCSFAGPEVFRLYIQAPFQRLGLGRAMLSRAEARAGDLRAQCIWLTAWSGNSAALAFYPRVGYSDVGTTQYLIAGKSYENRIFAKRLASSAA